MAQFSMARVTGGSSVAIAASLFLGILSSVAFAQDALPPELANDPVTKKLGAKVMSAAIKEGVINWYGGTTTRKFLKRGGKKRFEKRFGIKIKTLTSANRKLADPPSRHRAPSRWSSRR